MLPVHRLVSASITRLHSFWFQLSVTVLRKPWLSSPVTIYDCRHRNSCVSCVGGDLPCVWCPQSHSCTNRRQDCLLGTAIISPSAPRSPISSDRTGAQYCPKIEADQRLNAYLTPAGQEITVEVQARNLIVSLKVSSSRHRLIDGA